ncbi:ABC transporter substrate-binding protein [Rhizohabitans arisaemae]|uniref:ABC transporter substrate-binding protein n=1 Tax=Rhizohabitans arisaemae TaxID=2720610 RepID=UPI0024B2037C|nr:ABC transporter substrate-binding protein [Rhizohabitans arisaemae]
MRSTPLSLPLSLALAAVLVASCGSDPGLSTGGDAPKQKITWSYSAAVQQTEKVPISQALDALKAKGFETKEEFHQSGEDAIQAVARGQSDFGVANASAVLAATQQNVPIKALMTAYLPGYVLAAPVAVKDPSGLGGLRIGIHAKVSATSLYTSLALKNSPPKSEPQMLVVPGSANRIRALAAGQLDASMIQLSEVAELEKLAPGKFHIIYNVPEKHPEIMDSMVFTSVKGLEKADYVKEVLRAVIAANKAAYSDGAALTAAIVAKVPKATPESAAELVKVYTAARVWPEDGAFDDARINATIEALRQAELLKAVPTVEQCCAPQLVRESS